jgi:hypothetical protein
MARHSRKFSATNRRRHDGHVAQAITVGADPQK